MHRKKALVALVVTGALLSGVGVAWAMWEVRGFTTAPVEASNGELEASGGAASDLFPGGYQDTTVTVTNPNSYPVNFGRFSLENVTVDPQHEGAGCPPGVVRLDPSRVDHVMTLQPAASLAFQVGIGLDSTAPEACKGAVFQVTYRAAGWVG